MAITADEMLDRVEDLLRRLSLEYEIYFSGGRKLPPRETEWRLGDWLRQLEALPRRSYAQDFRLAQLQQRRALLAQLCRRRQQVKEEGWRRASDRLLAVSGARPAALANAPVAKVPADAPARQRFTGEPAADEAALRRLFQTWHAQAQPSGPAEAGAWDRFAQRLRRHLDQLWQRHPGQPVEAEIVASGGEVKLKLRLSQTHESTLGSPLGQRQN